MTHRDDLLAWVQTALYEAELALHNGAAAPRRALRSRREPVSVLGSWRKANGQKNWTSSSLDLEQRAQTAHLMGSS